MKSDFLISSKPIIECYYYHFDLDESLLFLKIVLLLQRCYSNFVISYQVEEMEPDSTLIELVENLELLRDVEQGKNYFG